MNDIDMHFMTATFAHVIAAARHVQYAMVAVLKMRYSPSPSYKILKMARRR